MLRKNFVVGEEQNDSEMYIDFDLNGKWRNNEKKIDSERLFLIHRVFLIYIMY